MSQPLCTMVGPFFSVFASANTETSHSFGVDSEDPHPSAIAHEGGGQVPLTTDVVPPWGKGSLLVTNREIVDSDVTAVSPACNSNEAKHDHLTRIVG